MATSVTKAVTVWDESQEPLLQPSDVRFTLFPIQPKDVKIRDYVKQQQSVIWTSEEIDMSEDMKQFKELPEGAQRALKHALAFFASGDQIVLEGLAEMAMRRVQNPWARAFYATQMHMESIHSETYNLMIDCLIPDPVEKERLFNALEKVPSVTGKADWARKWIGSHTSFAEFLVAFACVEGIFFSGSFCIIFFLKEENKMTKGLGGANELIARDEGLHCDFACYLYQTQLQRKLPMERVHEIVRGCLEAEIAFIRDAIPLKMIGMSAEAMQQYIEFCADRLLYELGYPKLYNRKNPFGWMEKISLRGKTNFFEKRALDYQKMSALDDDDDHDSTGPYVSDLTF